MRERRREATVPLLLVAAAFALAFAQRPGLATADTKINLHVDPGRFLGDAASMWTSSGQLGDVQAGQQVGYLFPMGPFFAAGHALGLSDWVVQRLWLGSLLAAAALGVVWLLDALLGRPRGAAALVAGAVMLLNPFVVTYANRTTVTLLAYAALPWLLLAVHRGLREPRSWRWPAAVALLIAASGPGVNAAVTVWMLLGPLLLVLYELAVDPVAPRDAAAFLARAVPLALLVSLWWMVPAYIETSYGINFLPFTEQPGTVWGTTSVTESLRLMGFWLSYVGLGFGGRAIPYFGDATTLLFSVPVVLATLLVPAAALAGFVWTRRWRYGPFFLALALLAVLIMSAGFPEGTPLRHGLYFVYNHVAAVRFLRASYKAAPLLAIALACLAGTAAAEALRRLGSFGPIDVRARGRRWSWLALGAAAAAAAVLALSAWPLVTGHAQDAQVSYERIPAVWHAAADQLDHDLPPNSRAIVLPGELFSFYTWGGTVDPILPALSTLPVAERSEVPYSDLRATDLLWTIDGLVHQQRLLPGQLGPLLKLTGVRSVITATDEDRARSDAPAPGEVALELAAQPGFARPARTYGSDRSFGPAGVGPPLRLPEIRRYDLPAGRGLIRVEPQASPVLIDGSAEAIAGLAAFGALPSGRALLYAGDLDPSRLPAELAHGGELVISDSNRRQAFVASSLDQNTGPVLPASQSVSADGEILDPFGRGADFETVASYSGVRSVQAPYSPQRPQFPEHAPFAAIDGSTQTAWIADPTLAPSRRWLEVDFDRPLKVPYVELMPYDDVGASVRRVAIAGRSFAVHAGWNRLPLGLRAGRSLRVALTGVTHPAGAAAAGAGGITELRIPGVHASEALRPPVDAASALAGRNLDAVAITYLFDRTTGDHPYRRDLAHAPYSAFDVNTPGDAEQAIDRVFELPAARRFQVTAWVNVLAQTPDDVLDRIAGYHGPVVATSSSRVDGIPEWRASHALDGDPRTAWVGDWNPPAPAWIQWRAAGLQTVRALRLVPPAVPVRRPSRVRVLWQGGSTPPLTVAAGGIVKLPHVVAARSFRLEVLRASAPAGASAADARAVGIAEIRGVDRLPLMATPARARVVLACGAVRMRVGAATIALRVDGSMAAFESGTPLLGRSCGAPVTLAAGTQRLLVQRGPLAVDELRLLSPATRPGFGSGAGPSGRVLASGSAGRGSYDGVRVAIGAPSWLVLGESYDRGWRASCNGRSLGAPTPIDGYANGWRVGAGCRDVRFVFEPGRAAMIGYLVSALAALGCAVLLLLGTAGRRRRRGTDARPAPLPAGGRERAWPLGRAVAWAIGAAVPFGFVFGVRAGVAAVPVIAAVLALGIGARTLVLVAAGLLGIVVPVLYVVHTGAQSGGNHATYAVSHMAAHWVGVAALGLLMGALWRTLNEARRGRA
jgi:hypothetical protein